MTKTFLALALGASAVATSAAQAAAGDVIVRTRAIAVVANEGNGTGALAGAGVNNDIVPEVDFTYMATKYVGFELIAGTSMHKVSSGATTLARSYVLPPTMTAQYHFMPESPVRPYVGAGLNYTIFFAEKGRGPLAGADVNIKDSFGWAAQAGVDVDLNETFFLNLDVKYIDMKAKTKVNGSLAGTLDINPLVIGVGFGTRF